jgi:hypothetical protein
MRKPKRLNLKQVKIMSNNTEDKAGKNWTMALGLYPGILFGVRTYHGPQYSQTVIYLPFIDLAIEWEN